jgi:hypothetical protein
VRRDEAGVPEVYQVARAVRRVRGEAGRAEPPVRRSEYEAAVRRATLAADQGSGTASMLVYGHCCRDGEAAAPAECGHGNDDDDFEPRRQGEGGAL